MSYGARTKDLFRKYGRVAVGVHFAVYGAGLATCYVAVERGVKVEKLLQKVGLLAHRQKQPDATPVPAAGGPSTSAPSPPAADDGQRHDERSSWWQRALAGSGSSLALAFICNKALFPVRAPITLGLTPMVARALAARGWAVGTGAAGLAEAARPAVPPATPPPPRPPYQPPPAPPPPPPPQTP